MKFKSLLTTLIASSAISLSAHAIPLHNPLVCPKAQDIKAEGLFMGYHVFMGLYFTVKQSHYNTEHNWLFGIGPIDADNEEEALNKGRALLPKLSGNPVPGKITKNEWGCAYTINQDYLAVAVLADDAPSPLKLKQFFKAQG
ncbi:DUF4949 domain-containing protein [Legionella impletisoli]|uniref:Hemin binding protein Hbp n=1 Tax=Legionella impletisoli TaxID=343510 RepID=A0A917JYF8_9GAMM|nr:DUF4949 domain-containing protein [Legionella impletisoli]GGI92745.1 hypothetical protein GCM10007966_21660 [Legionella impletisoli]